MKIASSTNSTTPGPGAYNGVVDATKPKAPMISMHGRIENKPVGSNDPGPGWLLLALLYIRECGHESMDGEVGMWAGIRT